MNADQARAVIEISANPTKLARGLSLATGMLKGFASLAARGVTSAVAAVNKKLAPGDATKNAFSHLGGNVMSKGLDAIVDGAQSVREFERNLMRLQITTDGNAASTAALRNQIRTVSRETAIASDEILAGASQYVALTGDADGASTAMSSFARIAQASGASVADVASATASLKTSMGLDAKDIEAAFSGMIIQGKAGAVEIKDMAGELATLAPQFAQFRGGQGLSGIREMGSAFQVIRTGAGSAGEAATQFQSLMGAFADTEVIRKLKLLKINLFDKDPKTGLMTMRSASDIFKELAANQKLSDPRIVAAIFGRKEAQSAVRSLRNHIGLYNDLRDAATDTGAVQRDLNTYLESDAGRLDKSFNDLKVAITEAFTPERIAAFVHVVEDLVAKITPLFEGFAKISEYTLGFAFGVGKKVRDILSDGPNTYKAKRNRQYIAQNGLAMLGKSDDERAAFDAKTKLYADQSDAFDATVKDILGAQVNDRSTPESVRRAVIASYRSTDMMRAGNENAEDATRAAGVNYLNNVGVTLEQRQELFAKEFGRELAKTGAIEIAKALAAGLANTSITAEVGKDKIVEGNRTSAKHRTRTAP